MSAVTDPLLARRFGNLAASLSLIAGIGALYALVPYYRDYFAARPPWLASGGAGGTCCCSPRWSMSAC